MIFLDSIMQDYVIITSSEAFILIYKALVFNKSMKYLILSVVVICQVLTSRMKRMEWQEDCEEYMKNLKVYKTDHTTNSERLFFTGNAKGCQESTRYSVLECLHRDADIKNFFLDLQAIRDNLDRTKVKIGNFPNQLDEHSNEINDSTKKKRKLPKNKNQLDKTKNGLESISNSLRNEVTAMGVEITSLSNVETNLLKKFAPMNLYDCLKKYGAINEIHD